jgi:hypothetical protein
LRAIFKGWAADPVNFVGKRTTKDRAADGHIRRGSGGVMVTGWASVYFANIRGQEVGTR